MAEVKAAWTRLALWDLEQAHAYIAADRPAAANQVLERIRSAVVSLARHPEMGRNGRVTGTRELPIPGAPFILAYRLQKQRLEILALIHGARRWPDAL